MKFSLAPHGIRPFWQRCNACAQSNHSNNTCMLFAQTLSANCFNFCFLCVCFLNNLTFLGGGNTYVDKKNTPRR